MPLTIEVVERGSFSASQESKPSERKRQRYSEEDKAFLESQFHVGPNPSSLEIERISARLGVETKKIQTWFNNFRQRHQSRGRAGGEFLP